jgi:excisionase family DNA binding protein
MSSGFSSILTLTGSNGGGPTMKDYFSVNELAEHFNVNPKTIYRRLWEKAIPAFKIGRCWRIARKDIVWLKQ